MELRLAAGEAVHSLRASVDNLVWGLGQVCGAKRSLGLSFRDTPEKFAKLARESKLYKLPIEIQTWIEDQQIYRSWDGEPSPLHQLNGFWNDDKHKAPSLLTNTEPKTTIGDKMTGWLFLVEATTTESGETIIVTDGPGDLNPTFAVELRFPNTSYKPALEFLREIHEHILTDVLPRFEPHFG